MKSKCYAQDLNVNSGGDISRRAGKQRPILMTGVMVTHKSDGEGVSQSPTTPP